MDVEINKFAVLSKREEIKHPAFLQKIEKTKMGQQQLPRQEKGFSNWKKQLASVQTIHKKVKNQRKNFLHKQSCRLANTYGVICAENLTMRNVAKNCHAALKIEKQV